jgi:hypothetical protein
VIFSEVQVMLVFGIPDVILSLLVSVIGVLKQKIWLVLLGAILFAPFS